MHVIPMTAARKTGELCTITDFTGGLHHAARFFLRPLLPRCYNRSASRRIARNEPSCFIRRIASFRRGARSACLAAR